MAAGDIDTGILNEMRTHGGENIHKLSQKQAILLVFLRHFGCIFCREAIRDVHDLRQQLEARGILVVFVHLSDPQTAEPYFLEYGFDPKSAISDPECRFYAHFGLVKGSFSQLYGLKVWMRGFEASRKKGPNFFKKQLGDGLQMPGIFIIHKGQIRERYIHKSIADRPDYESLIAHCALD